MLRQRWQRTASGVEKDNQDPTPEQNQRELDRVALQACDVVTDKEFLEASLDEHEGFYSTTVARLKKPPKNSVHFLIGSRSNVEVHI